MTMWDNRSDGNSEQISDQRTSDGFTAKFIVGRPIDWHAGICHFDSRSLSDVQDEHIDICLSVKSTERLYGQDRRKLGDERSPFGIPSSTSQHIRQHGNDLLAPFRICDGYFNKPRSDLCFARRPQAIGRGIILVERRVHNDAVCL